VGNPFGLSPLRQGLSAGFDIPAVRPEPFDKAQDRPFDKAQDRPFDKAQDRPFDKAQDRLVEAQISPFDRLKVNVVARRSKGNQATAQKFLSIIA